MKLMLMLKTVAQLRYYCFFFVRFPLYKQNLTIKACRRGRNKQARQQVNKFVCRFILLLTPKKLFVQYKKIEEKPFGGLQDNRKLCKFKPIREKFQKNNFFRLHNLCSAPSLWPYRAK